MIRYKLKFFVIKNCVVSKGLTNNGIKKEKKELVNIKKNLLWPGQITHPQRGFGNKKIQAFKALIVGISSSFARFDFL